jgi:hypothetical protein
MVHCKEDKIDDKASSIFEQKIVLMNLTSSTNSEGGHNSNLSL